MTMQDLAGRADLSWMRELRPDPEAAQHKPNKTSRQVRSGHWVPVRPTALPRPKLVIHSPEMAKELGISEEACQSQEFLRFFSGDIDAVPGFDSWATPYALSIMGQPRSDNCPFKTGNGYGDGRAVSIGEVLGPSGQRWEMQLKGGGQTPFCRRADGRAVLRSSVREFLASEAMHHLGISTTRAISLIVSQEETTQRPWYSGRAESGMPGLDDPRIAQAPPELRRMLLQMLAERQGEPDVMIEEQCAITCRVAPSFMRIGHLDLFARRASRGDATPEQREELEMIVRHAMNREFADVLPSSPLAERVIAVFEAATDRIAAMVAGWLRVGFCQGNFNCDNCLVGGRQMDYGPFGFIDKYDPSFAKWVGSGEHFAFMNQPKAALANLGTLTTALSPLLDAAGKKTLQQKFSEAKGTVQAAVDAVWHSKLGFEAGTSGSRELFATLEPLMQESGVDYTIMFRQMGTLPGRQGAGADEPQLLEPLREAFYEPPPAPLREKWASWLRKWLAKLACEHSTDASLEGTRERMRLANPKYILREYMLVEAYSRAKTGDFSMVHELFRLIKAPYDEQPDLEAKYYRRAPDAALATGGTSVMT